MGFIDADGHVIENEAEINEYLVPPYKGNRRPKIFFATQVATAPPTIVLKCNDPGLFSEQWKRYLLGVFREELPFKEVPIRLYFRSRQRAPDEPTKALDEAVEAIGSDPE